MARASSVEDSDDTPDDDEDFQDDDDDGIYGRHQVAHEKQSQGGPALLLLD